MAKIGELLAELGLDTKKWKAGIKTANKDIAQFDAKLTALSLGGTAALAGMTLGMFGFADAVGKAEGLLGGFARSFGADVSGNLEVLRTASKGTISDVDLMQTANSAALLQVTNDVEMLAAAMTTARLRGKEMGLGTKESFQSLVTGIGRGSVLILDNIGIAIPEALKEMRSEMTEAEFKAALLQTVIADGQSIFQAYGEDLITAKDKADIMRASMENMKITIGGALIPVFEQLLRTVLPIVRVFSAFVQGNPKVIANFIRTAFVVIGVVTAFAVLNKAVLTYNSTLKLLRAGLTATQLSIGLVGIALVVLGALFAAAAKKQLDMKGDVDSGTDSFGAFGDAAVDAGGKVSKAMRDSARRIADIRKSIEEEKAAFEDRLRDIVLQRMREIKENEDALDKENKDFKKSQEERLDDYTDRVKDQKKQNTQEVKDLEESLRQSVVLGSDSYQRDLENFRTAIEAKKLEGEEELAELKAKFDEASVAEQEKFDERTSALQVKLDEDKALLEKHAKDIEKINLDVQKDEIDILKETHAKRLEELDEQITREKAKRDDANKEAGVGFANMMEGINAETVNWDSIMQPLDMSQIFKDMGNSILGFFGGITEAFTALFAFGIEQWLLSAKEKFANLGADTISKFFGDQAAVVGQIASTANTKARSALGFEAAGTANFKGGRAMIGERGMEEVVLPPGSQIFSAKETAQRRGGNQTVTFNQVIDKRVDIDAFNDRQGFILAAMIG